MAYPRQHLLQAAGAVAGHTRCRGLRTVLAGPLPGREDQWPYDSDWLTEIQAMGAQNYYPPMR